MDDEQEADRRWRTPTWRDGLVSLAVLVVGTFVALPACNSQVVHAVRDAVSLGPDLVRVETRLAGGLAAPVALWALLRRLRRDDAALRPPERYLVHAAAMIASAVGAMVVAPPSRSGWILVAPAAASVVAGAWLLAPTWWRGAWAGARAAGMTIVGGFALAVSVGLALGVLPAFAFVLLQWKLGPIAWASAAASVWLETVVSTALAATVALAAWASAAEYDAMPDRTWTSLWGFSSKATAEPTGGRPDDAA